MANDNQNNHQLAVTYLHTKRERKGRESVMADVYTLICNEQVMKSFVTVAFHNVMKNLGL